jgi:hypothetical protein
MAYPVPKVEIAFNDGPYVASPTWTDVTPYVRELSTDRGRQDDWGSFDGSASVTLNNRDRRFDPFYTSGPYYGKLTPRRQIRISATYSGTDYPVFRGYINGWPPAWTDAGQDSTVTLSCMDGLGFLASETLPADWSRSYILSTSPRHYYPCDEPVQPFLAGQPIYDYGSYPLNASTTAVAQSGSQLAVGLVNSCLMGTTGNAGDSTTGAVTTASDFSACMWVIFDPDTASDPGGITGNTQWTVSYEPATSTFLLYMYDFNGVALIRQWRTVATFDGSTARNIAFTFNVTTKAITFYVDGVLCSMTTLATVGTVAVALPELFSFGSAQIQQVCIWLSVQPQSVFQNIVKYSTVNLPETTAARFTRLFAETQFPTALTSGPSAPASGVLDITDDAPKLATELQRLANSEYAPLFCTRDGIVTLYNQNQIRTQTRSIVSQGTYGTGGYGLGQEVSLAYDGDSLRNQASITMSGSGVYIKDNLTSQGLYGAAQESLDTEVSSLANAQSIANIITGWGGQVYPQLDPIDVVISPTADWSNALNRELNDRVTVVVSPPTGNSISYPMLLSRISHSALPGEWQTTFTGSARWAAVFILNQSTLGGTDLLG